MTNVFRTLVIPFGQAVSTRNKLKDKATDPTAPLPGLDGMFLTPMSVTGNLPATHYCSSGWVSQAESDFLDSVLPAPFEGNTEDEISHPFATFERLGLKMITEAI